MCVCVCLITSRGNSCSEYGPNVCVCVRMSKAVVAVLERNIAQKKKAMHPRVHKQTYSKKSSSFHILLFHLKKMSFFEAFRTFHFHFVVSIINVHRVAQKNKNGTTKNDPNISPPPIFPKLFSPII